MNKPLTIDELKALQVGDWVWLVDIGENVTTQEYRTIKNKDINGLYLQDVCFSGFRPYASLGKDWLVYKNKEEAEALEGYTVSELTLALNNEHNAFLTEKARAEGHRKAAGMFLQDKNALSIAIEFLIDDIMSDNVPHEQLSCNECPKKDDNCIRRDCIEHWKEFYLKQAKLQLETLRKSEGVR